jgi:hypothetical protein
MGIDRIAAYEPTMPVSLTVWPSLVPRRSSRRRWRSLEHLADAIGDVARGLFGRERDEVIDPEHAVDAADCQFSGLPLERVPDAAAELDVTVASSTWPDRRW